MALGTHTPTTWTDILSSTMHNLRSSRADNFFDARPYLSQVNSNGRKRTVYYLIEEDNGFAGARWGVSYCVMGLDPWRYKDGYCRTVR